MDINQSIYKPITFRCYAEINDFLSEEKKGKAFIHYLKTPVLVGEAIESIGIPLSEVDLILVNSKPVNFNHRLYQDDYVSVYPVFESFDISDISKLRSRPLRVCKFILDAHLGKLAKYLRMLGFDTLYQNDFGDKEIIRIANEENRIILTRDKLLLKSKIVQHGYYVRAVNKHQQLSELVNKFDLYSQFKTFTRCMTCNAELVPKLKNELKGKIDDNILETFDRFYYCYNCDKVFWQGSHFKRMERYILELLETKPA